MTKEYNATLLNIKLPVVREDLPAESAQDLEIV